MRLSGSGGFYVLLFFIFALPLSSMPKIYFGFEFGPLILDIFLIFYIFLLVLFSSLKAKSFFLVFWFVIFLLFVFYAVYSDVPGLYLRLSAFRLSCFYFVAFLIPFFFRWDERKVEKIAYLICVVAIFVGINGFRQWFTPLGVEVEFANSAGGAAKFYGDSYQGSSNAFRIYSTFLTSVHFVIFMTLSFFLSFYFYFVLGSGRKVYLLCFWVSVLAILLSFSRSAWVAILVAFLPAYLQYCKRNTRSLLNSFLLVASVIVLGLIFYNSVELVKSRIDTLASFGEISSFQTRLQLWESRLENLEEHPLGFGSGSAGWNVHDYMNLGSDSNYLKFLIEYGYFGGTLIILFIVSSVYRVWSGRSHCPLNTPIFCFLFSILLQMITNQVSEAYPSNFYIWLFLGLGISLTVQNRNAYQI